MRRRAIAALAAPLLVGPTVLAFLSGGYFSGPRVWAGAIAWAVALLALALGASLPRGRFTGLALGGIALFAAWSAASTTWAPIAGDAYDATQIAVLYAGALLAACLVARAPAVRRAAEPVLAGGATVVIGYGLAGRLLPGVLHYARSVSAQGRLEQPLTYWNAMGELAAIGLVLCVALAGERERPAGVRALAAAACAPLGLGLYTSFSRGALFAAVAGLVALLALRPRRELLDGASGLLAAVLAAAIVSPLHGVTSLDGSLHHRESQGLVALVIVLVLAALAAVGQTLLARRVAGGPLPLGRWDRRRGAIATVVICAGLALAIVVGSSETSGGSQALTGGATRLVSLRSNRYDYWSVALRTFADHPLDGIGAGNWQVEWLHDRHVEEFAQDAHSLPLQTLAELGIVGAIGLAALLVGVFGAGRRALRGPPSDAVGVAAAAALVTYLAHAPLDWDWEMPAVTLVAIALAGLLLGAAADRPARG